MLLPVATYVSQQPFRPTGTPSQQNLSSVGNAHFMADTERNSTDVFIGVLSVNKYKHAIHAHKVATAVPPMKPKQYK